MDISDTILMLSNVSISRRDKTIVNELNLALGPGVYALLGCNGSGKTTLLSSLSGILPVRSGDIRISGIDLSHNSFEAKKHLSYLPEKACLYPFITGREYLSFMRGVRNIDDKAYFVSMTRRFELQSYLDIRFDRMSLGTQRKFMVIGGFAGFVGLYLLDEPTNALDSKALDVLKDLIKRAAENGAVVFACHDSDFVGRLGADKLVLGDGVLEYQGRRIAA